MKLTFRHVPHWEDRPHVVIRPLSTFGWYWEDPIREWVSASTDEQLRIVSEEVFAAAQARKDERSFKQTKRGGATTETPVQRPSALRFLRPSDQLGWLG